MGSEMDVRMRQRVDAAFRGYANGDLTRKELDAELDSLIRNYPVETFSMLVGALLAEWGRVLRIEQTTDWLSRAVTRCQKYWVFRYWK